MFDTVFGLPVHILVIHVVVVLGPLTALLAIGYAARPAWRPALAWWLVAGAVLTGITGIVAGASGEDLERRVRALPDVTPARLEIVHDHAEAGDLARVLCILLMLLVLAAVFALLPPSGEPRVGGRAVGLVTAVALVVVGLGTTASVTLTGHSGAKAAWADQVQGPLPPEGSGGGEGD